MTDLSQPSLGVAVVGLGQIGAIHAQIVASLATLKLVVVADIDVSRAKRVAAETGARWTTDYREVLADPGVDFVIISTPDHQHREPAVLAAAAGKHILLEKPMAQTLADADAIIDAVERAGVKLMVGHTLRFETSYVKIREAIEAGGVGEPLSFYGRQNISVRDARAIKARVGISFYVSVHNFDLMGWYLREKPVSVYSVPAYGRVHEEFGKPDGVWTLVTFSNGRVACDEAFWCLPDSFSDWQSPAPWASGFNTGDCRVELIGTNGVMNLQYPPTPLWLLDEEGWKFPDVLIAPTLHGQLTGALKEEIEHFALCVRSDRDPVVTAGAARQAVELAIAAERSLQGGAPVKLPLTPEEGR